MPPVSYACGTPDGVSASSSEGGTETRHQDDELLHILEGEVDVTVLAEDGVRAVSLQAGSMFIVPRGLWHNQLSRQGVKLVFVTSQEGNEESSAEDPRTNRQ
ncbi:MAG: cupin domain-containing protein [Microcoleus sp. SIO2G3]|nr:cupin domain-containing protein [Microcoleus sp. SIO2G3]